MDYLHRLARQWQLRQHVRFSTRVESAQWDESNALWRLALSSGRGQQADTVIEARYLVSAVGQLNTPYTPAIPGLDGFRGKTMHSALWDASVPLTGRVAVVGTGASAIQLIPEVAKRAGELHVMQRSAAYILPRGNARVSWYERLLWRLLPRVYLRRRSEILARQDEYHGVVVDEHARAFAEGICTNHRQAQIPDSRSELRDSLTPSYMMGCKRVLISDDFYPAMLGKNTALHTGEIQRASAGGLIIGGKETAVDTIIFATGFRSQSYLHVRITGRHERTLSDLWADGPYAYYGVVVDHMPNFGLLYGPNTNLSHFAVTMAIEAQAAYIAKMIRLVVRDGWVVVPKASAVRQYNDDLQDTLRQTSFASPTCTSWYKATNGKVTNNWPGTAMSYVEAMEEVQWDAFDCEEPAAGRQASIQREQTRREQREPAPNRAAAAGIVVTVALGAFLISRALGFQTLQTGFLFQSR